MPRAPIPRATATMTTPELCTSDQRSATARIRRGASRDDLVGTLKDAWTEGAGWRPTPASPRDLSPGAPAGAHVPRGPTRPPGDHTLSKHPGTRRRLRGHPAASPPGLTVKSSSTGSPHPPCSLLCREMFSNGLRALSERRGSSRATRDSKSCRKQAAGRVRETVASESGSVFSARPHGD